MANNKMAVLIGTAYTGFFGDVEFKHPPIVVVTENIGLDQDALRRLAGSFGYDGPRDVVTVVPIDSPRVEEAEYGLIEMTILAAEPREYKPRHQPPGARFIDGRTLAVRSEEEVDKSIMLFGIHLQNLRASAEREGTEWDVSWVVPTPERAAPDRSPRVFGWGD